jgi:glycosyltransferase involved in cell wall biosynthesis
MSQETSTAIELFVPLRDQTLFLVWGQPSQGPRSQVFARELDIEELHFLYSVTRRGLLAAPAKYSYQAVQTMRLLMRRRPRIVFIQSPPSIAVIFVYLYCALTNGRYVIDAHSDAFYSPYWSRPRWLHRFLARKAVTTIVTNEHFQQMIDGWGGHAFVLRDIPTTFPDTGAYSLNGEFNVVVVNTFTADEPLEEVLAAAADLDTVQFHITGKKSRAGQHLPQRPPDNVHFTDFLPNETYYALLSGSQAVMCLTKRDHTMQRGACEALSLGKPIITSDWPLLQTYFHKGAVHVDNTAAGIRQGVQEMKADYTRYETEIKALQKEHREEWPAKIALLTELIQQSLDNNNRGKEIHDKG